MAENNFEVEKIIGKKWANGRAKFLVKWQGFSHEFNEWVFEEDCNCPEMISEYESKDILGILGNFIFFSGYLCDFLCTLYMCIYISYFIQIGSTKTHIGIKYGLVLKNERLFTMFSSEKMKEHPADLLAFLQSRIKFIGSDDVDLGDFQHQHTLPPNGQPKVLG